MGRSQHFSDLRRRPEDSRLLTHPLRVSTLLQLPGIVVTVRVSSTP